MKLACIPVWKFDELPQDLKEKVLQKYRYINVDHEWWDHLLENFITEVAREGIIVEYDDISFDIYSRNAHFGVYTDKLSIDFEKFMTGREKRYLKIYNVDYEVRYIPRKVGIWYSDFPFARWNCTEGDAVSFTIYFDEEKAERNGYEKVEKRIRDILSGAAWRAMSTLTELCRKYYRALEEEYDHLTSDEAVAETLRINEYMFDETGTIVHGFCGILEVDSGG